MLHTRHGFGDVLGAAPLVAAVYGARQGHFAADHHHFDIGGIDQPVVAQPVGDILADPVVRAGIALRSAAAVVPLSFTAPEPGGNGIGGPLDEAAVIFATALEVAAAIIAAVERTAAAAVIARARKALAIATETGGAAAIAEPPVIAALVAPEIAAAPAAGLMTVARPAKIAAAEVA